MKFSEATNESTRIYIYCHHPYAKDSATKQAGIGVYFGPKSPRNVSERLPGKEQTVNRGRLYALIRAIESVEDKEKILICTDSKYIEQGFNFWVYTWNKNQWKTKKGESVKFKDLWKTVLDTYDESSMIVKISDEGYEKFGLGEAKKLAILGANISRTQEEFCLIQASKELEPKIDTESPQERQEITPPETAEKPKGNSLVSLLKGMTIVPSFLRRAKSSKELISATEIVAPKEEDQ
jgi:ribonuclease HI